MRGQCSHVQGFRPCTLTLPGAGNLALLSLFVLALISDKAWADSKCRSGASLTYQYGNTILEHAADQANDALLHRLRQYVPSAQPITFDRGEHVLQLSYNRRWRGKMIMRFYGGFSVSPDDAVYRLNGDGYYKPAGSDLPMKFGQVNGTVVTSGTFYVTGGDLLFQTGGCNKALHLVGGLGPALAVFKFNVRDEFDAVIAGETNPAFASNDSYWGIGVYANVLGGLRLDLPKNLDVMVLGGYRVGTVPFVNVPIYGHFVQITLGHSF